jgi:hypothetical protein
LNDNVFEGPSKTLIACHKRTIEQIKYMLRLLHEDNFRQDRSASTIQSQNQEAANIIQAISAQLKSKNKKYKALKKHVARLSGIHGSVNAKLKLVREKCDLLCRKDAQDLQSTIVEIQGMLEESAVHAQNGSGSSGRSISSLLSNGSTATFTPHDFVAAMVTDQGQERAAHDALFRKAAALMEWKFETDLALYEVRQPVDTMNGMESNQQSLFSSLDTRTPLCVYSSNLKISDPASLEVAVRIKTDCGGGILILSGENTVCFRPNSSSDWIEFGNVNLLDRPLGWAQTCSLDQILEEAHMYRQKCCQSLFLAASSLAREKDSGLWAVFVRYCGDSKVLATFCILLISMAIKYN